MSELHDILSKVASGDIDPDEAGRRIDALGAPADPQSTATFGFAGSDEQPTPPTSDVPVTRIRIRADGMRLSVIADPQVATAVVVGPHSARTDDGVLTIGSPEVDGAAYRYEGDLGRFLGRLVSAPWGQRVNVRVNPSLPIEVENNAGSLFATGLRGGIDFRVAAGSVKVLDTHGPVNGNVATGSAYVEALFTTGESHISAELGSVDVKVLRGSDVRVQVRAEQGSAKVSGGKQTNGRHDAASGMVGTGAALLSVDARLGSAKVELR
jgi:hypothetical protein